MIFIQCNFKSVVLEKNCPMNVLLPQSVQAEGKKNLPVVYLLHGLSDDHSGWMRRTSIERYAEAYNCAVVMPDAARSFYTNMKHGLKYWTFISEELPTMIPRMFPVSKQASKTFVAGFSMGGYGALKLALTYPERFAAVGAMSSVTDIIHRMKIGTWTEDFKWIFGAEKNIVADGCDLFDLAKKCKTTDKFLPIIQICGTEDYLYKDNVKFRDMMQKINWKDFQYFEEPGEHTWDFWDRNIQKILKFFFEK